jgi:phosphoglycerate dehydrogenase-like enzyme
VRVAVLNDIHGVYASSAGVARLRERAAVDIFTESQIPVDALTGYQALVANRERTRFPRAVLEQLSNLRIIAQTGNHVYHIDMQAAQERGVIVAKATGGFSRGAAELTFGLMIAVMRGVAANNAAMRAGGWPSPLGRVLHAKTLGIVGLGHVGRAVAQLAAAFGMRVVAWGPSLSPEVARAAGCEYLRLDDLVAESDVVSVHATLSPASRGLLDAARLARMKPTAYLINTARGPIVDESALVAALRAGRLAGAALDVFDTEPLPADHPLRQLDNVVLSPHVGWPTDEAYAGFANAAADVLLAYMDGRPYPRFDYDGPHG